MNAKAGVGGCRASPAYWRGGVPSERRERKRWGKEEF